MLLLEKDMFYYMKQPLMQFCKEKIFYSNIGAKDLNFGFFGESAIFISNGYSQPVHYLS